MAGDRTQATCAWPGDIIGLHNPRRHPDRRFRSARASAWSSPGIPNFAPELFRRVRTRDPLKSKQLEKGLHQLAEEGATQVFKPMNRNELVVGAVGVLQFDVVAHRLREEYRADCLYEDSNIHTARWIHGEDASAVEAFQRKHADHLAVDGGGHLAYLAPTRTNLQLTEERWPELEFRKTREH